MEDSLHQTELFIGRVISTNPETYTISVMPFAGRMGMHYVRVMTQNASVLRGKTSNGYYWMPHINDTVVCAFVEGMPDYPICLGVLFTETYTRPPSAATKNVGGVDVYQQYDYVVQQQTGSYIRMRNNNQPVYNSSTGAWTDPAVNLSEITVLQQLNDPTKSNSIVMKEVSDTNATITVTHHSGAYIKIDDDGNIFGVPAAGKKEYVGAASGTKKIALNGDSTSGHAHTNSFTLTAPPGGGPVTGSITINSNTDTIVASSTNSEAK